MVALQHRAFALFYVVTHGIDGLIHIPATDCVYHAGVFQRHFFQAMWLGEGLGAHEVNDVAEVADDGDHAAITR